MNIKKIAKTNLEFMDYGIYNPNLKTVDSLLKNEITIKNTYILNSYLKDIERKNYVQQSSRNS